MTNLGGHEESLPACGTDNRHLRGVAAKKAVPGTSGDVLRVLEGADTPNDRLTRPSATSGPSWRPWRCARASVQPLRRCPVRWKCEGEGSARRPRADLLLRHCLARVGAAQPMSFSLLRRATSASWIQRCVHVHGRVIEGEEEAKVDRRRQRRASGCTMVASEKVSVSRVGATAGPQEQVHADDSAQPPTASLSRRHTARLCRDCACALCAPACCTRTAS